MRNIKAKFHRFSRIAKDIVYPNRCPLCGILIPYDSYACDNCYKGFPYDHKAETKNGLKVYSVCRYGDVKPFVLAAKNDRDGGKLSFMAKAIFDMIKKTKTIPEEIDLIVPIPMHLSSRIMRGYNQTEKICDELSYLFKIPYVKAMQKIKRTAQQKTLKSTKRLSNLKGAFVVKNDVLINGKTILLVDDVSTTGATLLQATRVLKAHGAKEVVAVCFANATKDS